MATPTTIPSGIPSSARRGTVAAPACLRRLRQRAGAVAAALLVAALLSPTATAEATCVGLPSAHACLMEEHSQSGGCHDYDNHTWCYHFDRRAEGASVWALGAWATVFQVDESHGYESSGDHDCWTHGDSYGGTFRGTEITAAAPAAGLDLRGAAGEQVWHNAYSYGDACGPEPYSYSQESESVGSMIGLDYELSGHGFYEWGTVHYFDGRQQGESSGNWGNQTWSGSWCSEHEVIGVSHGSGTRIGSLGAGRSYWESCEGA